MKFDCKEHTEDVWNGSKRLVYKIAGCEAWFLIPEKPARGGKWIWSMEFPGAFYERCALPQLLAKGYYVAHIVVGNTYGCPAAIKQFDAFYRFARKVGMAKKVVLQGISRGGLYAYRWAALNPRKVAVIYGDAPVCDFTSWPGGKGCGKGSPSDWTSLLSLYGFKNEKAAMKSDLKPIDTLEPIFSQKIPLVHVVGDVDDVVPYCENSKILGERYQAMGGEFQIFHKPDCGHHPHGLEDPTPVVKFILAHNK